MAKKLLTRLATRALNAAYDLASVAARKRLREMAATYPAGLVVPPAKVEEQTAKRIAPTLQHVILAITGKEPSRTQVESIITKGYKIGLFQNFGEKIFINPHRIKELMVMLEIPETLEARFIGEAQTHSLLRQFIYANQAEGALASEFPASERGRYHRRNYHVYARDGANLALTRTVNQDEVKTGDNRPSVTLMPGIACDRESFDLHDGTIAKSQVRNIFFAKKDNSWEEFFVDPQEEELIFKPNIGTEIQSKEKDQGKRETLLAVLKRVEENPDHKTTKAEILDIFYYQIHLWGALFLNPHEENLVARPNMEAAIRLKIKDPKKRGALLSLWQKSKDTNSLVLDLADQGYWVYGLDFRGLGANRGKFDPLCFFDTLVSNDVPAVFDFIYNRPKKPSVVTAHSMGGIIAEFMLVRQAYKMNQLVGQIAAKTGHSSFAPKGKTRAQIGTFLGQVERSGTDEEMNFLISEARTHLAMLKTVAGLITLGSSKIFDKNHHYIFPLLLSLNLILPFLGKDRVPVDEIKWLTRYTPFKAFPLKSLLNPDNFEDAHAFLTTFVEKGTDSFPLGVGFQLLKAIYGGKGIRRMDESKFNYSAHLDEIPPDIPIFHIIGEDDPLAPPYNLAFIDHGFYAGTGLDFSAFPEYQHEHSEIHRLSRHARPEQVRLNPSRSQVTGFVVKGVSHLDLFYGTTADRIIRPLLHRLVDVIWQAQEEVSA